MNTVADFWAKVLVINDATSCWEWQGGTGGHGYGQFWLWGKQRTTHTISWQVHHGPVPTGMNVCHHCDNTICVRPDHLWLGTWDENMQDMRSKGRNGHRPVKLADHQIHHIHWLLDLGEPQTEIARAYDVHPSLISRISRGERRG